MLRCSRIDLRWCELILPDANAPQSDAIASLMWSNSQSDEFLSALISQNAMPLAAMTITIITTGLRSRGIIIPNVFMSQLGAEL